MDVCGGKSPGHDAHACYYTWIMMVFTKVMSKPLNYNQSFKKNYKLELQYYQMELNLFS